MTTEPFTLLKEWSGYGFQFNYYLRKLQKESPCTAKDRENTEFTPIMVRVNGQYSLDGTGWWQFTAHGQGRITEERTYTLEEGIPAEMSAWQRGFVQGALDRMDYEVGNVDTISAAALASEKYLIAPESVVGFGLIRSWEQPDEDETLHTNVRIEYDTLTTGYSKGKTPDSGWFSHESEPLPKPGKSVNPLTLWNLAGYEPLFTPQVEEALEAYRAFPRNSLGFRKGKKEIHLTVKDRAIGLGLQGVYKVIGVS